MLGILFYSAKAVEYTSQRLGSKVSMFSSTTEYKLSDRELSC
jgi:hypothetical protein